MKTKAKQIKPKTTGAPSNKSKKNHFEIYTEIISTLLKHEALTETEIADECGYKDKGKDKYAYVHRQINKLASTWNYIEHIVEPRPGYRIRRNPKTICHIYDDKKFESIRREFQTSPWLTDLIIERYLPEYQGEKEFLADVKEMLKTSPMMFEWYLRDTTHAHHTATLGEILGPSIPIVKTPGINKTLLEWFSRKGIMYDFFISCLLLEYHDGVEANTLPEELSGRGDEPEISDLKLAAINYILSFTMMQNLARCVDAIQNNDGNVPPFFGDIVKNYNTIAEHMNSDKIDQESLETEAADMGDLYNKTCKFLDDRSPVDSISGVIKGIRPMLKNIMKKSDNGEERKN